MKHHWLLAVGLFVIVAFFSGCSQEEQKDEAFVSTWYSDFDLDKLVLNQDGTYKEFGYLTGTYKTDEDTIYLISDSDGNNHTLHYEKKEAYRVLTDNDRNIRFYSDQSLAQSALDQRKFEVAEACKANLVGVWTAGDYPKKNNEDTNRLTLNQNGSFEYRYMVLQEPPVSVDEDGIKLETMTGTYSVLPSENLSRDEDIEYFGLLFTFASDSETKSEQTFIDAMNNEQLASLEKTDFGYVLRATYDFYKK